MTDPVSLLAIALAFLLGGFVKGIVGMGLPVVTVAILAFVFDLPTAMALMIVPGLAANALQSVGAPHMRASLRRIAPFLIPSLFTIWFGTGLLVSLDNSWLVAFLGLVLLVYAITNIIGYRIDIPARREKIIAPLFGLVNGVSTGMTGVTSTPSVIYLNGLGMGREMLVQSMGLVFFISYIVLTASLALRGVVNPQLGGMSLMAMVPAIVGMWLGRRLRLRTSEDGFKRLFFRALLAIALYLIVRAFWF